MTVRSRLRRAGLVLAAALLAPSLALVATAAPAGASEPKLVVRGGGWGHGVGMSQYGAEGMARQGRSAIQILQHYYRGTTVGTIDPSTIDVLIGAGRSAVRLYPKGSTTVFYQLPGQQQPSTFATVGAGDEVLVNTNGAGDALYLKVNGAPETAPSWPKGTKVWFAVPSATVEVVPAHRPDFLGWTASETKRAYRWGTVELSVDGGTKETTCKAALCTVIRGMDVEHYLRGLAESLGSFNPAAQQAQAITARTYAARKLAAPRDGLYHLRADTYDQYYKGAAQEGVSAWTSAVSATAGQVLRYGTTLAETYYFSTSGGYTENSEYVWVATIPYLRGVPDPTDSISPRHAWTREYSLREIGSWFGVSNVRDVRIVGGVGVSGRTNKATIEIVGTTTKRVTGNQFRDTINARVPDSRALLSTKFTFGGAAPFPDVPPTSWYASAVAWLVDEGITTGVGDTGLFKPDDSVTRAQMVTFLWRMMGSPPASTAHGFVDVSAGSWYEQAVRWAKAEGITTGMGGSNRFAPDEVVNRAQMATFLHRVSGLKPATSWHGFPDVPSSAWYDGAVSWAAEHSITTGVGDTGRYKPLERVTRGQMAAFLHRTASTKAAWAVPLPPTAP